MRVALLLLLVFSTLVSITLAVLYLRRGDGPELGPAIDIVRAPDRIRVLAGGNDDVELLLRPIMLEAGQDAFQRERLDELLGLRNPGQDYAELWVVSRRDEVKALSVTSLGRLVDPDRKDWQGRSLAEVLVTAGAEEGPVDAHRFVLEGLARSDLKELAARAFERFVVVLPVDPSWRDLDRLVAPELGDLELRRAEISGDALDEFLARPRGELLDRLVRSVAAEPEAKGK
ncbi:MAG: hypothetical protein H6807_12575 [Planctomycetes bacterium]|nr:hypothetical protein [Planctomycetota bacterium]